ncbi:ferric reductase [Cereibacter changlensis JA139]|uniref:Ferric reductase n=2 Tax=Cereibacter changlensis TaxID=402884 RepID=A0A2T4JX41_9RHOB|nr:ferric reductase-like transmembrane domain-containing protein [Cereibacter changlensis]PTE22480.1 ferric reductase [Cereibacter changlensis JA139]
MLRLKLSFWGWLGLLTLLWLIALLRTAPAFALRQDLIQYSGAMAIACMSLGLVLALRPRWPETWFGGLDKMYRLHKWLGIAAAGFAVLHWTVTQAPKWAAGLGLMQRQPRGEHAPLEGVRQFLGMQRGLAEGLGEWAFYAVVLLVALALGRRFPYHWFYRTHRLIALAYLVLVYHAVILLNPALWTSVVAVVLAPLLAGGSLAAVWLVTRRSGRNRQVTGTILSLRSYPGVKSLETEIGLGAGWPGHKPGQFAFATSDASEGPHPYTIASAWNATDPRIAFITKALGDHTRQLPGALHVGQSVTIEGPYGRFTFDDGMKRQIWIGGGIGITPFIARMKHLARMPDDRAEQIDLFHTTRDFDAVALAALAADAEAAGVTLHLMVDERDGLLTGARLRETAPDWREASIWFCGPARFGAALRADLAANGHPVATRFHQELFAMR